MRCAGLLRARGAAACMRAQTHLERSWSAVAAAFLGLRMPKMTLAPARDSASTTASPIPAWCARAREAECCGCCSPLNRAIR